MLWTTRAWPIWAGSLLLLIAGVINARTGKVPNVLTYPAVIMALVVAVAFGDAGMSPDVRGGFAASLGTGAITLLTLLFPYVLLRFGGGSLKAQTAFAAWLGCALPFTKTVVVSLASVALIVLAYLLAELLVRRFRRGAEEDVPRQASLTQTHMTLLTVRTVVLFDATGFLGC